MNKSKREMHTMLLLGCSIAHARFFRHHMTRKCHSKAGSRILNGFMLFCDAISKSSSVRSRNGFMRTASCLAPLFLQSVPVLLVAFQSTGWLLSFGSDLELHFVSLRAEARVLLFIVGS